MTIPWRVQLAAVFRKEVRQTVRDRRIMFMLIVAPLLQTVATQAGVMSSLLPSLLLSGMIFPIENMPAPLQAITRVVPARYLVHALRGILLKGNGLSVLWPDLVAQLAFAAVVLALATARFQRRLA